jgi:hypothetical protein
VVRYVAPGVDDLTLARWRRAAGPGTIDDRASRIAPGLINTVAAAAGIPLADIEPTCDDCGTPVVLVDGQSRTWPRWLHTATRDVGCLPDPATVGR